MGRFSSKRINPLDWDDYFSPEEIICLRSEALKVWEKILARFPAKSWKLAYCHKSLDFSTKAKQDLGAYFEHLFLFREIQKKVAGKYLFIINTREFAYLAKVAGPEVFPYKTSSLISGINLTFEAISSCNNLFRQLILPMVLIARTYFDRNPSSKKIVLPVKYFWDAANPVEMCLSPGKLTFAWIIDKQHIRSEDVVFLVPKVEDKVMQKIESSPYHAFTVGQLYQRIPKLILFKFLKETFLPTIKMLVLSLFTFENARKGQYLGSVLFYKPLMDYLEPACYITSVSDMGSEKPAIQYFNAVNIKTVMYAYSTNESLWVSNSCKSDFRNIRTGHVLASRLVVWHKKSKEFVEEHPQDGLEVKVIGPLMAGNEEVCQEANSLRSTYFPGSGKKESLKYVSVFDVTAWSKARRALSSIYPNPYTEEYCLAFIRDMLKLMYDFDNLFILFKPKRNITTPFAYSKDFIGVLNDLRESGRGMILGHDVNPWIPIALSDMCISMPFTSPSFAAMHYGKPALFYDPTGAVQCHRYQDISGYVAHSYKELKPIVEEFLFCGDTTLRDKDPWYPARAGFAGKRPGVNSSDEFRRYVRDLISIKGQPE